MSPSVHLSLRMNSRKHKNVQIHTVYQPVSLFSFIREVIVVIAIALDDATPT